MTDNSALPPVESEKEYGESAGGIVKRWLSEIDLYEKTYKKYYDRFDAIVERYRDERDTNSTAMKMNILWSNIETLKPAVYAGRPVPDVQRQFKDKDPVGRAASTVLERSLSYHIDAYDFDGLLKKCRDDYLLGSRGTSWVRYDPVIEMGSSQGQGGQDYEEVVAEHVACDYVYWEDFGHTPARTWDEVDAVWRKVYLTRKKGVARFGPVFNDVKLDTKPEGMSKDKAEEHAETFKTACVYEIWDKRSLKAYWICRGYTDKPLDTKPNPLKLERFFPCPKPLYGNLTTGTLVPLPDYSQYQDQAIEIDDLTSRIAGLTSVLKATGWYDGSQKDKLGKIKDLKDGELVPVDGWLAMGEKGAPFVWWPIEQVQAVISALYEIRTTLKSDLMEVTGMSDIVRGQGDPSETATAQQIKGQFASMRLRDRQQEMARFARDLLRIKAKIIAEQFSPETLAQMSGLQFPMTEQERMAPMVAYEQAMAKYQAMQQMASQPNANGQGITAPGGPSQPAGDTPQLPPPPEQPQIPEVSWEAIVTLLRNDKLRSYRIDIETDSTIALDEQMEKQARVEFLSAITPLIEQMNSAAQTAPALLPLAGESLMFAVRGFKAGRGLEETFEQTIDQLKQMASQPAQNPAAQELELEAKKAEQQIQIQTAKAQSDGQLAQTKAQADIQLAQAKAQAEMQLKEAELQHDMKIKEAELAFQMQTAQLDNDLKRDQAAFDYDLKSQGAAQEMEIAQRESDASIEQSAAQTEAKIEQGAATAAAKSAGSTAPNGAGRKAGVRSAGAASQIAGGPLGGMARALKEQTEALTALAEAMKQIAEANQAMAMMPKQISVQRDASGRLIGGMATPVGNA